MERTIIVSEEVYLALQRQALRDHKPIDELAEKLFTNLSAEEIANTIRYLSDYK